MFAASLLPVDFDEAELEEDDGLVPAPPGFAWLPWQTYLPLITCLLFLSAANAEQSICPDV